MAQAPAQMAIGVAKLLTDPLFSDFSMEFGDQKWKLHKVVLATQSGFFARSFKQMEDSGLEQDIEIHVEHEDVIDAVLQYLYTSDYSNTTTSYNKPRTLAPLVLDEAVHTTAWALEIPPLMELASSKFCEHAETDWPTPAFARAIRELYDSPLSLTQRMRGAVINVATRNSTALLRTKYGADFRAVLKEVKAFGADIQRASNEWNETGKRPD